MEKSYYESPIGILEIICENNKLVSLKLVDCCEKSNIETAFIKDIKNQINEYFSGKRKVFDIKINPTGTDFQKLVCRPDLHRRHHHQYRGRDRSLPFLRPRRLRVRQRGRESRQRRHRADDRRR